jgi:thiamine-monophosphate kinase
MGQGGEFDLIRRLLGPESDPGAEEALGAGVLVGPGDDCAVLEGGIVVSTDLAVEGVHFRRDWVTLEEAGYRATAAALSDLAAMAAEPLGALLTMALGPSVGSTTPVRGASASSASLPREEAEAVQGGARAACRREGVQLLGGDLSRSPGPLMLGIVALGRAERPLLRRGSEVGDEVWVTGTLGGSSAAVALWKGGKAPSPELRDSFAKPEPRIREALWLRDRIPIHGLIDLSDGLAGDAGHLAAASGVSVVLKERAIPVHPAVSRELGPKATRHFSLEGGEDFELCFTASPGSVEERVDQFQETFELPLTRVGWVKEGRGLFLESRSGEIEPLEQRGFSHFPNEEIE